MLPAPVGVGGGILQWRWLLHASVVDQHINLRLTLAQSGGVIGYRRVIVQIQNPAMDLRHRRELLNHRRQCLGIAVDQLQPRALRGKGLRQPQPDATGGAGNHHGAALIIQRLHAHTAVRKDTPTAP